MAELEDFARRIVPESKLDAERRQLQTLQEAYDRRGPIEAIRTHRALSGLGLKESKDYIEKLIAEGKIQTETWERRAGT